MPVRFQVDPDFYDHPKTIGMSDAAFSLWVRAGSFSAAKLTDGFIAEGVLVHTLRSSTDVADELVTRGLWRRVKGGYRFHQYAERNLTKDRIEADREADRERKRRGRKQKNGSAESPGSLVDNASLASGQNGNQQIRPENVRPDSNRNPTGIQPESGGIPDVSVSVSVSESVSGSGRGDSPPNAARPEPLGPRPEPTCPTHRDDPDPPACRRCKTAREAAEAWDTQRAQERRSAPQCQRHRGQPAHNCAICRSETIAAQGDDT